MHFDNTFRIGTHLDLLKKMGLSIELDDENLSDLRREELSLLIPKMFAFYLKSPTNLNSICDVPQLPN